MKIHLVSDEHLDHDFDVDELYLANLEPQPDIDVLIMAGDWLSISQEYDTKRIFKRYRELYQNILAIPGNHSMWCSSPEKAEEAMLRATEGDPNIHLILRPQFINIKGQEFFAGTLWYPKPHSGQRQQFIDMRQISDSVPWIYEQHELFQKGIRSRDTLENVVVVSHHTPSPHCIPWEFRLSDSNHFFMTNMEDVIKDLKPKLWLAGHSHTKFDFKIYDTRIVLNPRGYPHEISKQPQYAPLLIEI